MSWPVHIHPQAGANLREARDWYEHQRPGLGGEFLRAAGEAMVSLEEHSERHPTYHRGFRRVLTRRFPYKVFYLLEHVRKDRRVAGPAVGGVERPFESREVVIIEGDATDAQAGLVVRVRQGVFRALGVQVARSQDRLPTELGEWLAALVERKWRLGGSLELRGRPAGDVGQLGFGRGNGQAGT